jgi:hypothetical protein
VSFMYKAGSWQQSRKVVARLECSLQPVAGETGMRPDNPAETWAGRGLKPRWLTAAIKSGKKVEDFLITGSAASKANGRKNANGGTVKAKRAQAEVCPICDFQTTPPHDGRTHRSQKKKAPFSAAELTDKGLAKV